MFARLSRLVSAPAARDPVQEKREAGEAGRLWAVPAKARAGERGLSQPLASAGVRQSSAGVRQSATLWPATRCARSGPDDRRYTSSSRSLRDCRTVGE
jgi:hypothetical protein